jgi:hypothetical protein
MEHKTSLPHLKEPGSEPYPDQAEFSPHPQMLLISDQF